MVTDAPRITAAVGASCSSVTSSGIDAALQSKVLGLVGLLLEVGVLLSGLPLKLGKHCCLVWQANSCCRLARKAIFPLVQLWSKLCRRCERQRQSGYGSRGSDALGREWGSVFTRGQNTRKQLLSSCMRLLQHICPLWAWPACPGRALLQSGGINRWHTCTHCWRSLASSQAVMPWQ